MSPQPKHNQYPTGGEILADHLKALNPQYAFCVPGESYIHLLDGLYNHQNHIRLVTCRHESSAAIMAEAVGKLTGKPGVAIVTRGPGACNASLGVHIAKQDASPMILLVGQVHRTASQRDTFQEIDYVAMFSPIAKWAAQIEDPQRIPEFIRRAWRVAISGRPGPVVLALPEDMLAQRVSSPIPPPPDAPPLPPRAVPNSIDLNAVQLAFEKAKKPLILVGGGGWSSDALLAVQAFAERGSIPIVNAFRRNDFINHDSPSYAGPFGIGTSPELVNHVKDSDLLFAIGADLGEATTQHYRAPDALNPPYLIHVHPGDLVVGASYQPDVVFLMRPDSFTPALESIATPKSPPWRDRTDAMRQEHLKWREPHPQKTQRPVNLANITVDLRNSLPHNAILVTDAGNFAGWFNRHYPHYTWPGQVGPTNGAMGYGVPGAVAAKILHPKRTVVAVCGDGGVLMTGQDIATAVAENLDLIVIVVANGQYGTIRMHQEMHFPGRPLATKLRNPHFADMGKSYGAHGARVERDEDFLPAVQYALKTPGVHVIEVITDPDAILHSGDVEDIKGVLAEA